MCHYLIHAFQIIRTETEKSSLDERVDKIMAFRFQYRDLVKGLEFSLHLSDVYTLPTEDDLPVFPALLRGPQDRQVLKKVIINS